MTCDAEPSKEFVVGVFDRASSTYDQHGVNFFGIVGRTLVELAGLQPGGRVLDLGCGRGAATLPAADLVGPSGHVLAIDLAEGMVSRLREQVETAGLSQVTCRVGDAEAPDAEPGSWDVITASLVLFFLPNLEQAVQRYRQLLRPGGRLGFSWFADRDERWDRIYEALRHELPADQPGARRPGEGGPFSGLEAMDQFLTEAGYRPVRTQVRSLAIRYPDEQTWWATQWSHGQRAVMEKLRDAGLLESTMARVSSSELDAVRADDGSLEWCPEIAFTFADAPDPR